MPVYAQAARLSWPPPRDEEEADAAGEVPRRDGGGGAVGPASGADRAALSQGRAEGWASADAAGDDAARVLPPAVVRPERPDGLARNRAQLFTLFALGNLFLVRRRLLS